jgi:hypothetical protein
MALQLILNQYGTLLRFSNTKLLDGSHYLNDGTTVDPESVVMDEPAYTNSDGVSGRYGISTYTVSKTIDSTTYIHYLNDGVTADSDLVGTNDTDATSSTDLNRTTPAFEVTTTLGLLLNDGVTSDTNTAGATDSGGTMDLNPYGEAGYFLNESGLYVGNPINFTG